MKIEDARDEGLPPHSPGSPPDAAPNEAEQARQMMDHLTETNRVLMESRMIPPNQKLSGEQTEAIRSHFLEYAKSRGLKLHQIANEVGYSKGTLSEFNSGKYAGDTSEVARAINVWMERDARRQQAKRPKDYVQTWIADDMRTVIYQADRNSMMAAIVVPAGAGKTKVLKAMAEELRGLYIYCVSGMSERDLFRAIAEPLGWSKVSGTRGELRRFIVEKLADTNRILFLDEAHQLGARIGCIRGIHDEAHVAIVFAGTDEILRHVNDRAHGRGQFSSRTIRYNAIDFVRNAEAPGGGDGKGRDLFTIEEIKAFFAMKEIRVDRDALQMLWALACLPNYGTLRTVEHVVDFIYQADNTIELITRDHVLQSLRMLYGGECGYLQQLAKRHMDNARPATAAMAKAG